MEWVNNTIPMKQMIEKQLPGGRSLASTRATINMKRWLESLAPKANIQQQHVAALGCEKSNVVKNFLTTWSKFPKYVLREGIKDTCSTPELFLNKRANFIKSYACLCIGGYILGIGDRHLENFLVSINSGCIYSIDFGIAFDSGIHTGIPELIPFRLTSQIQDLVEPYSLKGHMRHALSALRKNQSLILDTCQIFIKEPLLEWVKEAQHHNYTNDEHKEILIHDQANFEKVEWYPQKKIDQMKAKLEGKNSALIMVSELADSTHREKDYYPMLKKALLDVSHINRKKVCLEVEEQVDFLIEHATDPNLLGRLWIGWSAYV